MKATSLCPQPSWETIRFGDESIKLLLQRMPRVLQRHAAALAGTDFAQAIQLVLDNAVKDWADVCDLEGKPIPFSPAGLDALLGSLDGEFAFAIERRVCEVAGLIGAESAADPTSPRPAQPGSSPVHSSRPD